MATVEERYSDAVAYVELAVATVENQSSCDRRASSPGLATALVALAASTAQADYGPIASRRC